MMNISTDSSSHVEMMETFGYGRVWMTMIQSSSLLGKRLTLWLSRLVICCLLKVLGAATRRLPMWLISTETCGNKSAHFQNSERCDLSSTERQAGDGRLQQHGADAHVSWWWSRWHPDPVHYQCHTCHLQRQWLESCGRIQVLDILDWLQKH